MTYIKGLQCIIGRYQIWKFSDVTESMQQNQRMDWLPFLMLNVLEAKIFPYDLLDQHNAWQNNHYWLSTERNAVAEMATEPKFFFALVIKNELL